MAEAEIGAGDIPIELGGKEYALKPSLAACLAISRLGGTGGLNAVWQRLSAHDFDCIVAVVAAGLGGHAKELPQLIWDAGVFEVAPKCIDFVRVVGNGGRPKAPEDEDKPEDPTGSGLA